MPGRGALLAVLVAATAGVFALAAGGAGAAGSRPCTAEDLEGASAPAELEDESLANPEEPLVAGTTYRVIVVRERAIGDRAEPIDSSIVISAPNGPPLQPTTENDRPAYDFTPTQEGSLRLVVSWDEEIGSPGSGDVCSTSQAFDLTVLAPRPATVHGSFRRGRGSVESSSFALRLRGTRPQKPDKVTVILRVRRGTTRPPRPRGRAFARFVFKPTGRGDFETTSRFRRLRGTFDADTSGDAVEIDPEVNIPFGRTLRFAFSFEVIQDGERIGGMRSGASCRRIQYPERSAVKCRAVRLKQRP